LLSRCRWLTSLGGLALTTVLLAGCMEALQSGSGPATSPPSALPSSTPNTVTVDVTPSITTTVQVDVSTIVIPDATRVVSTPTEPAALAITDTPAAVNTSITVVETIVPTPEATFALPTPVQQTNEERWRAQQLNRTIIDPRQVYATSSSELWWYDPVNQQHVILGTFSGEFIVQARFALRGQGVEAFEVPYQVNQSYGLTALSPAIVARIVAAGNMEWIETYVFVTPNITPR
jgi:hypothetical protein